MKKINLIVLFFGLFLIKLNAQDTETVIFSMPGGFYNNVFQLQLSTLYPTNHIRYTTNGNRPTAQSQLYTAPLVLDEEMYSHSNIYTILNCPPDEFFEIDSVQRCIVIRAAVFDENDSCVSDVKTNSYFIGSLGCDTHGLPVISICADSLDLFDYNTGIFIPGVHYDPDNPYYTGNYFMTGREWERVISFEFYETDNQGIKQIVGLRTHGVQQRWRPQKGMKIYAREEYGKKRLKYKFFETIPNSSFKHLCLKPYLSSWNGAGCQDYICGRIAEELDVESLASRPAVMFINGEYWGIYYISERPDERFLEDHYDVNIDSVNMISSWNGELDCGSADNYLDFYSWMENADLTDPEQYSYTDSKIDISNFIDYYILEMFSSNMDWPNNNMRLWQVGNGKFRWFFYDGDSCFSNMEFDVFANATYVGDDLYPSSTMATLFFRKLLENEGFMQRFQDRFVELCQTVFDYANTYPIYDYIREQLDGEVPFQIARFGRPSSYESWYYYSMYVTNQFLMERPEQVIEELFDVFSVDDVLSDDISVYPNPVADNIKIVGDYIFAEVYDITGKRVKTIWKNMEEIRVTDLQSGIYMMLIFTRNGSVVTKKIVKY